MKTIEDVDYIVNPGQVIAIIGTAREGPVLKPVYALDEAHIYRTYGEGEIVDAYRAAAKSGGKNIYMVRVDYASDREKYQEYIRAYESIEGLSVDVVVPAGINLAESVTYYPNIFENREDIEIDNENPRVVKLNHEAKDIEYIKYKGEKNRRFVHGEGSKQFLLDFHPEKNESIEVKYYRVPKINIELSIFPHYEGVRQGEITASYIFDIRDGISQSTPLDIVDYFIREHDDREHYTGENWTYKVIARNDFASIFYDEEGTGPIHIMFDYDNYIAENTEERYFVDALANHMARQNANAFIESYYTDDNLENLANFTKNLLNNKEIEYGRYISATPSLIKYDEGLPELPATYLMAGMCGKYQSHEPITNKAINPDFEIVNEFQDSSKVKLAKKGYNIFHETIRNGKNDYKAVTFAERNNPYYHLKVSRTMNELANRINRKIDEYVGSDIYYALDYVGTAVSDVINDMVDEEKIVGGHYELDTDFEENSIVINLDIGMEGEISSVQSSLYADEVLSYEQNI